MAEMLSQEECEVVYLTFDSRGSFFPRLEQNVLNGVTVFSFRFIPFNSKIKKSDRINNLFLWFFLKKIIKKLKINVSYTYYDNVALSLLLRAKRKFSVSVIMRMAGLRWYEEVLQQPEKKQFYEDLFNAVDSLNFISEGLRRLCWQRASEQDMILMPPDEFVLEIGAPLFDADSVWKGSGRPGFLQAVTATRFSAYQKRQDLLVYAVALLRDQGKVSAKNFNLLMVGEGSERERIQQIVNEYKLDDLITIKPFLPQIELWKCLKTADLLCHPCEYEGLGKIIVESMMMGMPVLVSRVPPLDDLIQEETTGFLVENTPEDWATELFRHLRTDDDRKKVSRPAQEYARRYYDPRHNARCYVQEFQRIRDASPATSVTRK
ncbi:hypothetical protein AU468_13420 [Alkalispirochaeta sphaeroplastigenens]|uniref:Glycosyl transferase family 1 domain-containing protein n=2 Tax=Alkalispirochaeta sphaeroplastigenens TaxID=1187066 RepID=A0A2S4JFP0_9SPIO|nr:hypothetical protein AU468_13420 [Alkalispirochaeta sphaeroplastigenens]